MRKWAFLAAGGILGTVLRVLVTESAQRLSSAAIPFGTWIVNVTGCLLMGVFSVALQARSSPDPHARFLLMAGFCGAYTTFSTFMLETDGLFQRQGTAAAAAYVLLSFAVGFAAFRVGASLAARF